MLWYGLTETKAQILARIPQAEVVTSKMPLRNTVVYTDTQGVKHVVLHSTEILRQEFDRITLNSGGWKTVITKERMDKFLPEGLQVCASNGIWYVRCCNKNWKEIWRVPFWDGMTIVGKTKPEVSADLDPEGYAKRVKKLIAAYLAEVRKLDKLPEPRDGDCFICCIQTGAMKPRERPAGYDCLEGHLEEKYIHGRLIYNALLWSGYRNDQMPFVFQHKDTVCRSLRRFFKAQLNIGM